MSNRNAARVYKNIEKAYANQARKKALSDPETFTKLAKARGYNFSVDGLEAKLNQLSDEEIAAIFNPGIPPRRHLFPR
ncbi:Nif11 family protein [Romeria aff. gracilis LEGE 07310]|uniref:Nif11 family protein n=1 Tax=Vasconcelosia minhoensis LEGE 07310 TaxID=915328 RepID=A0A8J7DSA6_9CYAN|nr:Nif11 family protein [Romeria gracilis]MBE9079909.1 Nif11 family protein [Romeria aff. gracilis LEGE 07310]